ncbi:MAG: hypothetical protein IJB83_00155 [Bacilli bacterium]|nr:hypothetical protein [Bacilli bacterium]
MEKNINYVRYEKALTDNEILLYSQIINQFKNRELDFTNLKNMFLNYGITIEAVPFHFSEKMMTVIEADAINKRISEQNYQYGDINYFILNSDEFKNIIFCMDYKAIEVLANYGISEYQETMISILTTQLNQSYDKDDNLAAERNKWKRRIEELKSQLSKNNSYNKTK